MQWVSKLIEFSKFVESHVTHLNYIMQANLSRSCNVSRMEKITTLSAAGVDGSRVRAAGGQDTWCQWGGDASSRLDLKAHLTFSYIFSGRNL